MRITSMTRGRALSNVIYNLYHGEQESWSFVSRDLKVSKKFWDNLVIREKDYIKTLDEFEKEQKG